MSIVQAMAVEPREEEEAYLAQALPTPSNTPYRTPSRSRSRRSSTYDPSSAAPSSSPPPLPPDEWSPSENGAKQEFSALDPRRFTPTLHANLVSEILSLRRDLDSKASFIDGLESSLDTARAEYDTLNATFTANAKETRSLRRQLQLLEGGTSSALGELARERDEAVDQAAETKRRLETSQRRLRTQEEDVTRVHDGWESDKQRWDAERRNLQRKVHVVEGRLKAILEEVAAQQAAANAQARMDDSGADSDVDDAPRRNGAGPGSDTASIRSLKDRSVRPMSAMSIDEKRHVRLSTLSGLNGALGAKAGGFSLADELAMDAEDADHYADALEVAEPDSAPGLGGSASAGAPAPLASEPNAEAEVSIAPASAPVSAPATTPKIELVDRGTQPSPPPTPTMTAKLPSPSSSPTPPLRPISMESAEERATSPTNEANQRRKRMAAHPPATTVPSRPQSIVVPSPILVSAACQTLDGPLSPPKTPISPFEGPSSPVHIQPVKPETVSAATQTEQPDKPEVTRALTPPPMPVPSIAIHPPSSAPSSPGKSILPPQTKSAACQVTLPVKSKVKCRSMAMQTEEIRVDKRLASLPPNLLPSAIKSTPPTPERTLARPVSTEAVKRASKKSSKRSIKGRKTPELSSSPPVPARDAYPGQNDDGLLRSGKTNRIKRPFRSSSLFAGFDVPSSDEADEFDETDAYENEFGSGLTALKPRSGGSTRLNSLATPRGPKAAETESEGDVDPGWAHVFKNQARQGADDDGASLRSPTSSSVTRKSSEKRHRARQTDNPLGSNPVRGQNFRKSALISSGAAAHSQRARSPSLDDIREGRSARAAANPPFPVPTRSSSRRIPISSSEGARSPTRLSHSGSLRKRHGMVIPASKRENLRKVRSAAAIARNSRGANTRSRSPPPLSISSATPDSPRLPPLPTNELTSPRLMQERQRRNGYHHHQPSSVGSNQGSTSVQSSFTPTNVVDAISQTMVGEWMWKYVRKRTSFGITDPSHNSLEGNKAREEAASAVSGNGTGVRHKRWVWLAPYERAVMWSSKQPTSGSALLGKSGRKLTIQSVLDVKDDTPGPKGSSGQTLFNRSILILTPARALKFTATSKERHYTWLTALSFLSQSSDSASEIFNIPPRPSQDTETLSPRPPGSSGGLRRGAIRDSIRVAKGKARPELNGPSISRPAVHGGGGPAQSVPEISAGIGSLDSIALAADPPIVPRFTSHNRRRSNTGPRAPPSSYRSFSHQTAPSSTHSFVTNGSSEAYGNGSSIGGLGLHSGQSSISRGTSEGNGAVGYGSTNFFDAVGTVRMEAFVRRPPFLHLDGADSRAGSGRGGAESKREKGNWHVGKDSFADRGPSPPDNWIQSEDPFRGF